MLFCLLPEMLLKKELENDKIEGSSLHLEAKEAIVIEDTFWMLHLD